MKRIDLMICSALLASLWTTSATAADMPAGQAATPAYISGGVGDEELAEMRSRAKEFNLRLLFAEKQTGSYLAGVKVTIESAGGGKVLDALADGPLFYTNLPSGNYRITAEANGQKQSRTIAIPKNASREWSVYWAASDAQ